MTENAVTENAGTDGVPDGLKKLASVMREITDLDGELGDSLYDAIDNGGLVEVTLTGRGRLVGLKLDDRLLSLGPREAAARINETAGAALELVNQTYAEEVPEMRAQVERVIAALPADVQAQIRRSSGYADGASTS